ncbi:cupin domain-containing protein [Mesorhizobium sp. LHD-90]|uniref:cupin domain-containing protein n=1 Tax=Mesorhizobium sp. LHD-90 TaxID=3071414 RepID=UPI0027E08265|nr:cupin domain-containing protein [Mesorhizobium sp. LHD-90]MDQ6433127.1 cupin domain-containing protein [Mesorhizobium sp. LHD-90]
MATTTDTTPLRPLVLAPGEGRAYAMPAMRVVFKADGAETGERYSISEWWVEPHGDGPGAHSHEANDEIFYVIEGTASVLVGDRWIEAPRGSFFFIPAGTTHDFANRTEKPMGLFNVFVPGGFEENMPAIVRWYQDNAAAGA